MPSGSGFPARDPGAGEGARPGSADRARSPEEWKRVVEQIRAGDPAGQEALYSTLSGGARFFFQRRLGTTDVDDLVHEVFLTVTEAILAGEIREPERLMGFVRTILFRKVAAHLAKGARAGESLVESTHPAWLRDRELNAEEAVLAREKVEAMRLMLGELRTRDVELLTRFYLREQGEAQIRTEMGLSGTQFRLLKSRAKARFRRLVQKRARIGQVS
jgi:DNA-directed RNA polymerase specialized sigma24 family protein